MLSVKEEHALLDLRLDEAAGEGAVPVLLDALLGLRGQILVSVRTDLFLLLLTLGINGVNIGLVGPPRERILLRGEHGVNEQLLLVDRLRLAGLEVLVGRQELLGLLLNMVEVGVLRLRLELPVD